MTEFPCLECGTPWPEKFLAAGRCLDCAFAWEDEPVASTTVEAETRTDTNCIICGRMHNRSSELCAACDADVIRDYERYFDTDRRTK